MGQNEHNEGALSARSRPQYHYFYGSTDNAITEGTSNEQEQESLIGEELVATDHEEDTPNSSEHDLQHLLITNGNSTKPWFFGSHSRDQSNIQYGVGRILGIILLALAASTFLIVLLPRTSEPLPEAQQVFMPFQEVNRADFGDPVEGFIEMDLFHPTLLSDSEPHTFVFPFPTGAFWTNLIVPAADRTLSFPIAVYPYAYKWSDSFLQLSYPAAHRFTDEESIRDTFAPELTIGTIEDISNRYVTKFDPLSVTLRFVATAECKWETALVQGSPYATMKYLNATPVFRALSIFKSVQCPGDDDENFSDLLDEDDGRRRLFGVCSIGVSMCGRDK
jgi:endoglucanase Acf2